MAASFQCRILIARKTFCQKHRITQLHKRYTSKFIVDYRTVDAEEETFEDLRDVSRLSERLKSRLPKHAEAPEPDFVPYSFAKDQKNIKIFQRRMYAKFGEKYAINPSNLWPTKDEIAKEKLRDSFFDIPLEDSLEKLRIAKEEREENMRKSEELIEKNMQKMDEWIQAYEERKKVATQKEEKSAAKRKLVEDQLYDHFGYEVSIHSTKAKDYLKEAAEKEKKARKIQSQLLKQEREKAQLKEMIQKEVEEELKRNK